MKNIKQFWKKLKYWQKGGVIGIFFYGLYITELLILAPIVGLKTEGALYQLVNFFEYTLGLPNLISVEIVNFFGCHTSPCFLYVLLLNFVTFPIIWIIIWFLIGKIKKKWHR